MRIIPFRLGIYFANEKCLLKLIVLCLCLLLISSVIILFYVDYSLINNSNPLNISRRKTFLLIVIVSCGENVEKREVIRNTWLQLSSPDSKYIFVIGGKNMKYHRTKVEEEISKFSDILLLPDVDDSYEFLSLKILNTFVVVNKNWHYQFLLKCDDDTFVRVNNIILELKNKYLHITNLYWGFFHGSANVKKRGRWKETQWVLCDRYLPYALGGGYVLSESLVRFIAFNKQYLVIFQPEDVTVGTWLAAVNATRIHDPRFDTEYISRGCSNTYLITHKHEPSNMKNFYSNIKNTGQLCDTEFKLRKSYIYNWDVPPSRCCIRNNSSIP